MNVKTIDEISSVLISDLVGLFEIIPLDCVSFILGSTLFVSPFLYFRHPSHQICVENLRTPDHFTPPDYLELCGVA